MTRHASHRCVRTAASCAAAVLLLAANAPAQVHYPENDDGAHEIGIQGLNVWPPLSLCGPPLGMSGGSLMSAYIGDDPQGYNQYAVLSFDTQTWIQATFTLHLTEAQRLGTPFQDLGLAIVEYKGSPLQHPTDPNDVEGPGYTNIGYFNELDLYASGGIDISSQVNAFLGATHDRYFYLRFRIEVCKDAGADWDVSEIATGIHPGRAYIDLQAPPSIPPHERDALIALYSSTNGPGWTDSSGWLGPVGTECSWYGVTCDAGSNFVENIYLASNGLTGTIPPELGNLANLIELELWDNQLMGSIPPELGDLGNLRLLFLDINQLTGTIPPELGNLANLWSLYLDINQLTGAIPPELGNLASIRRLFLWDNQLSESIPPELGNLATMTDLRLTGNQLSGEIPATLQNLVNLIDDFGLDIRYNQLYTDDPLLKAFLDQKQSGGDWESFQIPTIRFDWTPITPETGETVSFTDNSTSFPDTWSWSFGDGGSSSVQHPTHVYGSANTYSVTLTASNSIGSDSASQLITVAPTAEAPVSIFTWVPTSPDVGETVSFYDYSTGDPTSWSWDFGDGGSSSAQEPSHTYTAGGVFTVTLTVANAAGSDVSSHDLTVGEAPVTPGDEVPVSPPGVVEEGTSIDTDRSGNRVVVWSQSGDRAKENGRLVVQGDGDGIFGRYFDPDDEPVGDVIEVADGDGQDLGSPTVSFDGAGNFVIGWESGGGADQGVFGRAFDPDREPLTGTFDVDDDAVVSPSGPEVATASGGDFVMVWRDEGVKDLQAGAGVFGRFFDPDGDPKGETIRVSSGGVDNVSEPSVAAASSGHSLVVWSQRADSKQAGDGVFGRYFDPDGTSDGDPIVVNDDPAGDTAEPSVGVDPSGNAVVVWAQDHGTASGWDIFGRRFDRDGQALGDQFAVNTKTEGDQTDPSVEVNAAGDFIVAWESGTDGVFGRYFDATGDALGPQFVMAEAAGGVTPTDPEISLGDDRTISLAYVRIGPDDTGQALLRTFDVDSSPSPCSQGANTNCLNRERFQVRVSWRDFQGNPGDGLAVRLTDDTGYYWFFDQANVEVMLKVLGGCGINSSFWVFYGALSNVEYTIVVTDSETGSSVSYFNPSGTFVSVGDTEALPCDAKAGQPVHTFREVPAQEWTGTIISEQTASVTDTCTPDQNTLCLNNDRFMVEATWRDFADNTGDGDAVTLTADTGYFWFFDQANVELVIKALDARGINGCYWVFFGALSNVEYTITVTDTETGAIKRYINPLGTFGSLGDTEAFCVP